MAKYYNARVKTGRLAGSVFAIRNGETIERAYQPVVYNPNTPAQVQNRAKLKLLSQVSAVYAPYIAIPRKGNASTRNLFVKKNYGATTYSDGSADVNLLRIALTNGVVGLPTINATVEGNNVNVALSSNASAAFDNVMYVAFRRGSDGLIRAIGSVNVNTPGADGGFAGTIPFAAAAGVVIYAYGVRLNTESARVMYSDLSSRAETTPATIVAFINTTRSSSVNDITLSETQAMMLTLPTANMAPLGNDEDRSVMKSKNAKN